ncbi:MAG: ATPase, T2SS/T4P/T4SS family [Candidatus Saelkia tenebricola]|nr:ATPase, T2SS/T4P/T4SS family [Candidatus Saelkia tenebricola]
MENNKEQDLDFKEAKNEQKKEDDSEQNQDLVSKESSKEDKPNSDPKSPDNIKEDDSEKEKDLIPEEGSKEDKQDLSSDVADEFTADLTQADKLEKYEHLEESDGKEGPSFIKSKTLEEVLIDRGLLTEEQLDSAKKESEETEKELKDVLIASGFLSKEHMPLLLGIEMGVQTVDLASIIIEPEIAALIPEAVVRKLKILPLFKESNTLTIAMADPTDIHAIDQLQRETGLMIEPVLASDMEIVRTLDQTYGTADTIYEIVKSVDEKKLLSAKEAGEEAPIVKLANLIMVQAVRDRASDIHIEPEDKMVRVRYRIDGVLHRVVSLPKFLQAPITSRMKIMSDLDIAERRLPQDGRIKMEVGNKSIDLRVSLQPTMFGENIVMRILDKSSIMIGIESLGFSKEDFNLFTDFLARPYGMIMVTGPTGSGKTTTLYSALNRVNTEDRNIMTMEDPIEYQLSLIRQTQVNPQIGLTYAAGLRAILRQDPDIIMVGEIRDLETAEIAVHSALTGHLVFSTLHTNDAASAFPRFIDMGIEPFLASSSIIGVIAQRLIRVICEKCKESYKPVQTIIEELDLTGKKDVVFYKGKGCSLCKGTGYKGRIGIYSMLKVTPKIQELIISHAPASDIDRVAQEEGMHSLRDDCLLKVLKGTTTVEEMFRVTQEVIV